MKKITVFLVTCLLLIPVTSFAASPEQSFGIKLAQSLSSLAGLIQKLGTQVGLAAVSTAGVDSATASLSLTGSIWIDANKDKQINPGEQKLSGQTVSLTTPTGSVLTASTDGRGLYTFSGLASGKYTATYTPINGYKPTTAETVTIKESKDLGPQSANFGIAATSAGIGDFVINHVFSTGQSLSRGADGCPALTTSTSTLSVTVTDENNVIQDHFSPLSENKINGCRVNVGDVDQQAVTTETPYSAMVRTIASLTSDNAWRQYVVGMHGVGGVDYQGLKKGTAGYQNGLNQAIMAKSLAASIPRTFRIAATTVVHGESDDIEGTPGAEYTADMLEWQRDYENDAKAITGQTNSVPLFESQMNSFTAYKHATSSIPEVQLEAAEQSGGKVILVAPKYFLNYRPDGLNVSAHLLNTSYRWLGEYYGKAMKQTLADGIPFVPLSPNSITSKGKTLTLTLHVPVPPIVIDTTAVLAATNDGFEISDGTRNPPQIQSVSITGPDTIVFELDHRLSTTTENHLRYAFTGVKRSNPGADQPGSARGNIRDSDSTPSLYGNTLYNWLVAFDKPITVLK